MCERDGRRNRDKVKLELPLRHPLVREREAGELLAVLSRSEHAGPGRRGAGPGAWTPRSRAHSPTLCGLWGAARPKDGCWRCGGRGTGRPDQREENERASGHTRSDIDRWTDEGGGPVAGPG